MNVTPLRLTEIGDDRRIPATVILKRAKQEKPAEVIVCGRSDDGELWIHSSLNAGQSLWLLQKAIQRVLDGNPWSLV